MQTPPEAPATPAHPFLLEVQGLRAIAVLSVLLFHVWPWALPGGYVGVDVFFVISGYLITGLLLRELTTSGSISLRSFYERRARRLLPAATLVLLATLAALPLLPEVTWDSTIEDVVASAFYVENWRLSWLAVDYLAADELPSPVQHYWSLSIEEQFYIVWPPIMIAGAALARRASRAPRSVLRAVLWLLTAASLTTSIALTEQDRESAYFITPTRVWELGIGGLLALHSLPPLSERTREAMRVGGLCAIAASCLSYSSATAFPGYAALLPTLGTALVIAAGSAQARWSSFRLLTWRPFQHLGDISYSLYLWHWPVIVLYGVHHPGPMSLAAGMGVMVVGWALAFISKRHLEDRFRHRASDAVTLRAALSFGFGSILLTSCAAAVAALATDEDEPDTALALPTSTYPGPSALLTNTPVPPDVAVQPTLAFVKTDTADAYTNGCHLSYRDVDPHPCEYGDRDSDFRVVLAGDSHAANWIPALALLAERRGWHLTTHTKSACAVLRAPVARGGKLYEACNVWSARVLESIRQSRPDLVVWAKSSGGSLWAEEGDEPPSMEGAIVDVWRYIEDSGAKVVAIADTPLFPFDPPSCLSNETRCSVPRRSAFRKDPIPPAATIHPTTALVDMTDTICTEAECPVVIGNVLAWRDRHHLTATYARMLGPILGDRIDAAIRDKDWRFDEARR